MSTFKIVADEFYRAFEAHKRDNGDTFYTLRDDAPAWLDGVMMGIHMDLDGRLPCDWVYETTRGLLSSIEDYDSADDANDASGEIVDGQIDIYNADLLAWIGTSRNADLVEEARDEGLIADGATLVGQAQAGQDLAIGRIFNAIVSVVESEADDRDDNVEGS